MIGVIGCGNMASAIVKGIHSTFSEIKFYTFTPSYTRAHQLAQKVCGQAVRNLSELSACEILIIACKPQQFSELARELTAAVPLSGKLIISIMAALSTERISQELGTSLITRVMPNTPAVASLGVSLVFHSPAVSIDLQKKVESYFSACSSVHVLGSEELFDKATVVTGSGPAYVYYFAKTMVDSLVEWGVDANEARVMVTQLFKGSSALMELSSDKTISSLIDEVTSKGGVTICAIDSYRSEDLSGITQRALKAAYQRSKDLQASL